MTSGLHSCKPGNEPVVGQVKTFVVQQMTGKSGKPYTKIRSANAENGGTPYRIVSAKPTGHTDSYGNVSFNIEVESAASQPTAMHNSLVPNNTASSQDERSRRIERQHSEEMAIRYAALKGLTDIDTEGLRQLIDWFVRDIGHVPQKVTNPTPDDEYDSDEPF